MSGRSAYVRKEKTKVKDGAPVGVDAESQSLSNDSSYSNRTKHSEHDLPFRSGAVSRAMVSPETEGIPYARVRKPHIPQIDVSGIEKSTFRSLIDKKSEGFRNGLAKTFGKKKTSSGVEYSRPPTSATMRPESHELEATEQIARPVVWPRYLEQEESRRAGPPQTKLPPIPQAPQLKQWMGSGTSPQPWNQLRRDPELWDPNGDTLVFFSHETEQRSRPQPSFRLSSHVLEATESQFILALLREGSTENHFVIPESPTSGSHPRHAFPAHPGRRLHVTPPSSDSSSTGSRSHISYELYFPAPMNQSKTDILRHQVTTRNVFAALYHASLVGLNLFQALTDLHARLESYMPPDTDAAGVIIDYLVTKGIDDFRDQPATAAALLAWSENPAVRWEEGWKEAYVHCAGMYNRLDRLPEFRYVTQVTRALLERGSLDLQVRIRACEDRFLEFEFGDMWASVDVESSPARSSFRRLQKFSYNTINRSINHGRRR